MYEHLRQSDSHYDAQTLDAATDTQLQQQKPTPNLEEGGDKAEDEDNMQPDDSSHLQVTGFERSFRKEIIGFIYQ